MTEVTPRKPRVIEAEAAGWLAGNISSIQQRTGYTVAEVGIEYELPEGVWNRDFAAVGLYIVYKDKPNIRLPMIDNDLLRWFLGHIDSCETRINHERILPSGEPNPVILRIRAAKYSYIMDANYPSPLMTNNSLELDFGVENNEQE